MFHLWKEGKRGRETFANVVVCMKEREGGSEKERGRWRETDGERERERDKREISVILLNIALVVIQD